MPPTTTGDKPESVHAGSGRSLPRPPANADITEGTVRSQRSAIRHKLDVSSQLAAVAEYQQMLDLSGVSPR